MLDCILNREDSFLKIDQLYLLLIMNTNKGVDKGSSYIKSKQFKQSQYSTVQNNINPSGPGSND
jgi:hypothetical protein